MRPLRRYIRASPIAARIRGAYCVNPITIESVKSSITQSSIGNRGRSTGATHAYLFRPRSDPPQYSSLSNPTKLDY